MAVKEGFIIIDGAEYDWLPGGFKRLPDRPVRKQTYDIQDLTTITVVHKAPTNAAVTYAEDRKIHRQGWVVEWNQKAPCSSEMRDHFDLLYQLQKEFWIQFDDVMIREGCILRTVGTDYKAYFTPTFPIAPYGYEDSEVYSGNVYINGEIAGGYTVTSELGLIRFDSSLTAEDVVTMDYSWRAKVRMEAFDMQEGFELAQHYHVGQITLLQTSIGTEPYNVI